MTLRTALAPLAVARKCARPPEHAFIGHADGMCMHIGYHSMYLACCDGRALERVTAIDFGGPGTCGGGRAHLRVNVTTPYTVYLSVAFTRYGASPPSCVLTMAFMRCSASLSLCMLFLRTLAVMHCSTPLPYTTLRPSYTTLRPSYSTLWRKASVQGEG